MFGLFLSIRIVKLEGIFAALSINMPGLDSDKQLFKIKKGRQTDKEDKRNKSNWSCIYRKL